jgi:sarcosine oxidase / L-pipecolate oxidase
MQLKVFLIVGSGVFGASTAYHMAKTLRKCRIILIEKSSWAKQCGASIDVNKIIRVEYEDPVYLRLALRAQKAWREETPWSDFYHPAEKVTVGELDSQKRILARMHQLGVDTDASIISVDETKRRYPGFLEEMAFHDCQETYLNPDSGWAEATPALARVIEKAVHLGVELVQATVSRILFNDSGDCIGVLTEDGVTYNASSTIIATGADTAKLLADSAPNSEAFRVENRLMGSGCVEAVVKLNPAQREEFANLPIIVHDVGDVYGAFDSSLPPYPMLLSSQNYFQGNKMHG